MLRKKVMLKQNKTQNSPPSVMHILSPGVPQILLVCRTCVSRSDSDRPVMERKPHTDKLNAFG